MTTILHKGRPTVDDWTVVEDGRSDAGSAGESGLAGASGSAGGKVIVTLARWRAERESLFATHAAVGVLVPNTADIEAIYPEISDRSLIVLQFPTFTDGRALSQAMVLRKRLGFRQELRAIGDVIQDLVFWLGRCGFDSIVPRGDQNLEACGAALREFTVAYQAAADGHTPVWVRRRKEAAAAVH